MANDANVQAIAAILRDLLKGNTWSEQGGDMVWLAEKLAYRGVLVPAALTDEEAGALSDEHLVWFRAELERIARGDRLISAAEVCAAEGHEWAKQVNYPGGDAWRCRRCGEVVRNDPAVPA